MERTSLPPGPKLPATIQTVQTMARQRPQLERKRRRYGNLFSIKLLGLGTFVVCADPKLVKQVFTADPTVLHAGTGSPLGTVLGKHSLLAIDEGYHLEQRKLLLPPFHGKRMQQYEQLIADVAAEEIDRWPTGVEFATDESFMRTTLRAILRAVFGAEGEAMRELERTLPHFVELGSRLATLTLLQKDLGPMSPWGRFLRTRAEVFAQLDHLIDAARVDPDLEDRADILALMVQARHTDGTPMTNAELRDQLVTLLAAGHETTAGTLAWAVERLRRHPQVWRDLADEADAGGRALRDATIREVQRQRPVIAFSARHVMQDGYRLAGHNLPRGVRIGLACSLTHFDPDLFPQPDVFRPERFVEAKPETYSWIPFGGGIRRCIGAAFAHMEMEVVLRTMLERVTLEPTSDPASGWRFRGVAHVPADGGRVVVRKRAAVPAIAVAA